MDPIYLQSDEVEGAYRITVGRSGDYIKTPIGNDLESPNEDLIEEMIYELQKFESIEIKNGVIQSNQISGLTLYHLLCTQIDCYNADRQLETEDFEKYLESIKPRFDDFDTWIIVGFICYNNFDGNDIGFSIFNKWSKYSDKYEGINSNKKKWDEFTNQYDKVDHKLSYKQLLKWNMEDFPPKNKYKTN